MTKVRLGRWGWGVLVALLDSSVVDAASPGRTNLILRGEVPLMGFGLSLAGGDFDGDGYGDLVIGEPDPEGQAGFGGRLKWHPGAVGGLKTEPRATISGVALGCELLGMQLMGVGDVDGDGKDDLAVAVRIPSVHSGSASPARNAALIVSGASLDSGRLHVLWRTNLPPVHAEGGVHTHRLGDLDRDGVCEVGVTIGESGVEPGGFLIVWGARPPGAVGRVTSLVADESGAAFGISVCPWPDLDGDGVDDLLVGSMNSAHHYPEGGGVRLWSIDAGRMARRRDVALHLPRQSRRRPNAVREQKFGAQVVSALRRGRGGVDEVVVSAPWADNGDIDEGVVSFFGWDAGARAPRHRHDLDGDQFSALLGLSMGSVGDVNGDGWDDLLVAAPFGQHGQFQEGLVFLFAGARDGFKREPVWAFQGEAVKASLGRDICPLGDVDGDGFADFAVSAPDLPERNGRAIGMVQVFFGASSWPHSPETIRLGKPWTGRMTDWWHGRWPWEQGLALLLSTVGIAGAGAVAHRQWQKRTVVLVQRQDAQARTEERERFARDLHDELGPHLSRIHVIAERLSRKEGESEGVLRAQSDRLSATARDLRGALEQLVASMRRGPDTMDGLLDLLSRQADEFFADTGVRCLQAIPVDVPAQAVPDPVRNQLLPCVREALNNVLRHSKAREVWVRISWEAPRLTVSIEDDGVGFRESAARRGNGLANLRARMQSVNGICLIESAPGGGCRVSFSVDLTADVAGDDVPRAIPPSARTTPEPPSHDPSTG